MTFLCEIVHELDSHFWNSVLSSSGRISDECVGLAGNFSAGLLFGRIGPVVASTAGAFSPCESLLVEEGYREFLGADLRHLSCPLEIIAEV